MSTTTATPTPGSPATACAHVVWPALTQAFPQAQESLADAATWAQQALDVTQERADNDLAQVATEGHTLQLGPWLELTLARRSNALRAWVLKVSGQAASSALIQRLLVELPEQGSATWSHAGGGLRRYRARLILERDGAKRHRAFGGAATWPTSRAPRGHLSAGRLGRPAARSTCRPKRYPHGLAGRTGPFAANRWRAFSSGFGQTATQPEEAVSGGGRAGLGAKWSLDLQRWSADFCARLGAGCTCSGLTRSSPSHALLGAVGLSLGPAVDRYTPDCAVLRHAGCVTPPNP
jgi:hypothetical protein